MKCDLAPAGVFVLGDTFLNFAATSSRAAYCVLCLVFKRHMTVWRGAPGTLFTFLFLLTFFKASCASQVSVPLVPALGGVPSSCLFLTLGVTFRCFVLS